MHGRGVQAATKYRVFVVPNRRIYLLKTIDSTGKENTIEVSDDHPFWVVDKKWVHSIDLKEGDQLLDANNKVHKVISFTETARVETTYNLEVEGYHTYFAGDANIWVHNQNPCISISSVVKQDQFLLREARKLSTQESKGINSMLEQIKKGNNNPGIGTKKFNGITEFRHRDGGRIYAQPAQDGWTIVGYSGKGNQDQVIKQVVKLYGR